MNLTEKLDAQMFHDPKVRDLLNEMSVDQISARYGEPRARDVYSCKLPESKPALASDDPAVVQAMGRCVVARTRDSIVSLGKLHGDTCAWCEYPIEQLVAACRWGEWESRYIVASVLVWHGADHSTYERAGDGPRYSNPDWRRYWDLPVQERERRIAAVSAP